MNLISRLLLFLLVVGFLGTLGCTYSSNADSSNADSSNAGSELQEIAGMASNETGDHLSVSGQTMGIETVIVQSRLKTLQSTLQAKTGLIKPILQHRLQREI